VKEVIHKIPGTAMFKFMAEFRKLDNEIQAQTVQTFLAIAMNKKDKVPMADLSEILGVSQASCSRNVAFFTDWTRKKVKGPNLLASREDPMERRRKLVYLTPKGKQFYNSLENIWVK